MPPESSPQPSYQPQQSATQQPARSVAKSSNGLAIAGFILSFVLAPLGLILSIVALVKHRGSGKGLAIAGIIIGALGTLVVPVLALITLTAFNGVQQRAISSQTQTRANAVSKNIELYMTESAAGSYPTSAQLKDHSWITANLHSLDSATAEALTSDTYTYTASPENCANTADNPCTSYVITYKTSTGTEKISSYNNLNNPAYESSNSDY